MLHRAKALCDDYILELLPLTHASALCAVLVAEDQRKQELLASRSGQSLLSLKQPKPLHWTLKTEKANQEESDPSFQLDLCVPSPSKQSNLCPP